MKPNDCLIAPLFHIVKNSFRFFVIRKKLPNAAHQKKIVDFIFLVLIPPLFSCPFVEVHLDSKKLSIGCMYVVFYLYPSSVALGKTLIIRLETHLFASENCFVCITSLPISVLLLPRF